MERIKKYDKAILEVMQEVMDSFKNAENADCDFHPIIDKTNHRYLLQAVGWEKGRKRIFNIFFTIDIIENKIWIQQDNLEYSVAERLVEKGIPKKEIVLAYFPEFHRQHTEYAVA